MKINTVLIILIFRSIANVIRILMTSSKQILIRSEPRTHTNCFTALWILYGTTRVSRHQKKHSPTHTYWGHQSSLICFLHLLQSTASSLFNLCAWQSFPQSLSKFSLVNLLAWHHQLHTPYISSTKHCLLFIAHAHTIATCFAVVLRLCHLILVSLSTVYLKIYLVA